MIRIMWRMSHRDALAEVILWQMNVPAQELFLVRHRSPR